MRRTFSDILEKIALQTPDLIFITGDLGFNAFENLQRIMGQRFINAGITEQSMVSMAAGMASQGHRVIVYSIAPFVVYRALEQIRNDVCFHRLPVLIVGNGGGYGYGIMGSSHHALSDIATLSSLPDISCYVPAFKEDLAPMMEEILQNKRPAYLRLGLGKSNPFEEKLPSPILALELNPNSQLTVICSGPVIHQLIDSESFESVRKKIDLFVVHQFPIESLTLEIVRSLRKTQKVFCFDEHVEIGGLGSSIANAILKEGLEIKTFLSRFAVNYPDNLYGSQNFHLAQSGLDSRSIIKDILSLI